MTLPRSVCRITVHALAWNPGKRVKFPLFASRVLLPWRLFERLPNGRPLVQWRCKCIDTSKTNGNASIRGVGYRRSQCHWHTGCMCPSVVRYRYWDILSTDIGRFGLLMLLLYSCPSARTGLTLSQLSCLQIFAADPWHGHWEAKWVTWYSEACVYANFLEVLVLYSFIHSTNFALSSCFSCDANCFHQEY